MGDVVLSFPDGTRVVLDDVPREELGYIPPGEYPISGLVLSLYEGPLAMSRDLALALHLASECAPFRKSGGSITWWDAVVVRRELGRLSCDRTAGLREIKVELEQSLGDVRRREAERLAARVAELERRFAEMGHDESDRGDGTLLASCIAELMETTAREARAESDEIEQEMIEMRDLLDEEHTAATRGMISALEDFTLTQGDVPERSVEAVVLEPSRTARLLACARAVRCPGAENCLAAACASTIDKGVYDPVWAHPFFHRGGDGHGLIEKVLSYADEAVVELSVEPAGGFWTEALAALRSNPNMARPVDPTCRDPVEFVTRVVRSGDRSVSASVARAIDAAVGRASLQGWSDASGGAMQRLMAIADNASVARAIAKRAGVKLPSGEARRRAGDSVIAAYRRSVRYTDRDDLMSANANQRTINRDRSVNDDSSSGDESDGEQEDHEGGVFTSGNSKNAAENKTPNGARGKTGWTPVTTKTRSKLCWSDLERENRERVERIRAESAQRRKGAGGKGRKPHAPSHNHSHGGGGGGGGHPFHDRSSDHSGFGSARHNASDDNEDDGAENDRFEGGGDHDTSTASHSNRPPIDRSRYIPASPAQNSSAPQRIRSAPGGKIGAPRTDTQPPETDNNGQATIGNGNGPESGSENNPAEAEETDENDIAGNGTRIASSSHNSENGSVPSVSANLTPANPGDGGDPRLAAILARRARRQRGGSRGSATGTEPSVTNNNPQPEASTIVTNQAADEKEKSPSSQNSNTESKNSAHKQEEPEEGTETETTGAGGENSASLSSPEASDQADRWFGGDGDGSDNGSDSGNGAEDGGNDSDQGSQSDSSSSGPSSSGGEEASSSESESVDFEDVDPDDMGM